MPIHANGGERDTTEPRPSWACHDVRPQDMERFFRQVEVDPESGCHLWQGRLIKGYSGFEIRKRFIYGHRLAWLLRHGSLPPRPLHLDHLCRTPACVNPDHLEPVTSRENQMRSPISIIAAKANQTECVNGHEFDAANTYIRRDTGTRQCRACRQDRKRARRARARLVAAA